MRQTNENERCSKVLSKTKKHSSRSSKRSSNLDSSGGSNSDKINVK